MNAYVYELLSEIKEKEKEVILQTFIHLAENEGTEDN